MECVIFIGLQASGKSTFFKENFFSTHIRINLDMLKTRNREYIFLEASLLARQPFVIDNTNPAAEDRKKYIEKAKKAGFKVIAYFFEPNYEESVKRNEKRQGSAKVPEVGIRSVMKKLTFPELSEGFDAIYIVKSQEGNFTVEEFHFE